MSDAFNPPRWTLGGKAPSCTRTITPTYSAEALRIGLAGPVTLAIKIGIDGIAHNIRVIQGLGAGLDEQAVECLRQWTFSSALDHDGNPVAAYAQVTIHFSLPNSK